MRTSTLNQFSRSVETLQVRQYEVQKSQDRLISGKRVFRASDDPTAAARAERALAQKSRTDANQRSLEASRTFLVQAESALGNATDVMQRIRELTVQAGNASYGADQREALANEIRILRRELLSVANRPDGVGGFIFGGQGSFGTPFIEGAAGVEFRGTQGARDSAMAERIPLTVDGAATWLQAPTGNGVFGITPGAANGSGAWVDSGTVLDTQVEAGNAYPFVVSVRAATGGGFEWRVTSSSTPATTIVPAAAATFRPLVAGQPLEFNGIAFTVNGTPSAGDTFTVSESQRSLSAFEAVDRLASQLEADDRTGAQITQTVQNGLRELDAIMGTLSSQRARLGGLLNQADGIEGRLAESSVAAQTERSNAEDLDMVQGVSDFQARQTSYEAALKAYSMVQRLSLFDFLR